MGSVNSQAVKSPGKNVATYVGQEIRDRRRHLLIEHRAWC